MNIQTRKIEFIQAFLKIQSEDLISRLEELLQKGREEEAEFEPMRIEEFNQRVNIALSDSEDDSVTENSKLMSEIRQWN